MTSKTALHLIALPEEHLPQIISYLTLNDVCQLRLVSTSLDPRHVHHLWMDEEGENSHNITLGRGIMTSRRLQRMLSIFTNTTSLRLYGLKLLCRPAVTLSRNYLEVLQNSACAQNLECLELLGVFDCDSECNAYSSDWGTGSTPSYRGHADVCFPKLKRLAIGGVCHEDPQLIRSLLRSSHQITHLRLGGPIPRLCDFDIEIAIMQFHNNTLEELILDGCCGKIISLEIKSTRLRTLDLSGCKSLSEFQPGSHCPNLEELDLSNCSNLSLSFLKSKFCPRLKVLKLRMNTTIEEMYSADKGGNDSEHQPYLPHLEHIDIRDCPLLRHVSIRSPVLTTAEVRGCNHMQSLTVSSPVLSTLCVAWLYSLENISLDCPVLTSLDLTGCYKLSNKGMQLKCPALQSSGIRNGTNDASGY
uniref:F-box domain-containing protein n=1 Tax=Skeletonema marinoi TaxID=267567 RepID=A0A7S2PUS7_9STRA|mmetsp:Transcript_32703/g.55310  ORF Transcript_32703/g.55310 Transcript_32703/m.55310 type:complete len:416 (+) Transcript_32703:31-1278(+)